MAKEIQSIWKDTESAAFLGLHVSKLRKWRQGGGGPRWFKIGRSRSLSVPEFREFFGFHIHEVKP